MEVGQKARGLSPWGVWEECPEGKNKGQACDRRKCTSSTAQFGEGLLTLGTPLQGGEGPNEGSRRRNSSHVRAAQALELKKKSHCIEMGWSPTPNLLQMSRLMTPHIHQEGIKKVITHIISLSRESRSGSQEDLRMAGDFLVVRGWGSGKAPRLLARAWMAGTSCWC